VINQFTVAPRYNAHQCNAHSTWTWMLCMAVDWLPRQWLNAERTDDAAVKLKHFLRGRPPSYLGLPLSSPRGRWLGMQLQSTRHHLAVRLQPWYNIDTL